MTGSRRRSIPVTPTAIIVTFTYNITCMPNDMICQSSASNTPLYNAFSAALGISYSSFSPILPRCLLLGPAAISANSIYNITCLSELATTSCMGLFNQGVSETMARNMTSMMLFNMTRCGIQPPEPSGNCYDLSYISTALSNSSSIAAACKCSDGSDVAGSSAGSGAVGPAAGGAGAAILIILVIIIIVVVMRRKKNRQAPEAKKSMVDDRNVIAFANPMYDDQSTMGAVAPQPVYYGASGNADDGLYDEPAFTASQRANPVYQSTEELAGADLLAAFTPGYLDVAPSGSNAAEDAGYLGEQQEPGQQPIYDCSEPE